MDFEQARNTRRHIVRALQSRQEDEAQRLKLSREAGKSARKDTIAAVAEWLSGLDFLSVPASDESIFSRINDAPTTQWAQLEMEISELEEASALKRHNLDTLQYEIRKIPLLGRLTGFGLTPEDARRAQQLSNQIDQVERDLTFSNQRCEVLNSDLQTKCEAFLRRSLSNLEFFDSTLAGDRIISIQSKLAEDLKQIWAEFNAMENDCLTDCITRLETLREREH